ncbi:mechanosensitive ion channel family protein [Pseudoxanthomonas putridarboris]|uniref:Small-conductance mechanosensitive channel n=1 Tax=Pseudoxanthomonas putridarboris TaxID=752605 RepID=A0ABU9J063_9GAMM
MAAPTVPVLFPAVPQAASTPMLDWSSIDWSAYLVNWAIAIVILLVGYWVAKWISRILDRALTRGGAEPTLVGFLRNVAYAVMMVVVTIAALQKIGVPTTSVLAVVGAAGLAVGLALKDSLSNIASGVMLIVLRPFRDGDHVMAANLEGVVEEVRIFQTRLRTFDNRLIILPNSMITTAPIINFTAKPRRRVDIQVGVGYDDDLKRAKDILLELARNHPLVLKDPEPSVSVAKLGESSVDLLLLAWTKTKDSGQVKNDLTEAVRTQILDNGLNIPYPRRDLHVYHHNADGTPLTDIITKSVADDGDMPKPQP